MGAASADSLERAMRFDVLMVYTDGITDARVGTKVLGVEGLREVVRRAAGQGPREMMDTVFEAAARASDGNLRDDAAVFIVSAPKAADDRA